MSGHACPGAESLRWEAAGSRRGLRSKASCSYRAKHPNHGAACHISAAAATFSPLVQMEFPIYVYSLPNQKESPKYVIDMFVDLYFLFVACRWTLSVHFAVPNALLQAVLSEVKLHFFVFAACGSAVTDATAVESIPLANFEASRFSLFSICSLN